MFHSPYNKIRGGTAPTLDVDARKFIENIVAKDGLKLAIMVWLGVRVALSVWTLIAMLVAPPYDNPAIFLRHPSATLPSHDVYGYLLGVWNVFDARHYITIARDGYVPLIFDNYESNPYFLTAFFPGFPMLIKLVSFFTLGDFVLSALIVANLCAFFFFWYLYRLVEADYGGEVARRAVILSAVFPTSFYLFMGYTEAPLLAFTVASLYYGRQHRWWMAGILAGCAALIKQPGILLMFPLLYMFMRQHFAYTKVRNLMANMLSLLKKPNWAWLLLCPAALIGYYVYRYFVLQASGGSIGDLGANEILVFPGVPLYRAILAAVPSNPTLGFNLVEIGFTLLMISLVTATALKIRSATYSIYSIALCLISLAVTWPDVNRPEVDMPRRILIIFPIFIYLALVTANRRVFRYIIYSSIALCLILVELEVNWVFIS